MTRFRSLWSPRAQAQLPLKAGSEAGRSCGSLSDVGCLRPPHEIDVGDQILSYISRVEGQRPRIAGGFSDW